MANLPPWLESLRGDVEHLKPTALRARIQRLWAPDGVTMLPKRTASAAATAAADDEPADKEGGALARALKELQDTDWAEKRRRLIVYAQVGTEDQPCWLLGTCTAPGPMAVKQWQAVPLKQLGAFHRSGVVSAGSYATLAPPPADLTPETALQLIDPRHVLAHYRRSHPSAPAATAATAVVQEADPTPPSPPLPPPTPAAIVSASPPTNASVPGGAAAAATVDTAISGIPSWYTATSEQQRRVAAALAEVAQHGLPPGVFSQDNPPPGLAAAATPPLLLAKGEAAARPLTDVLPVPTNSLWPLPRNMPVLDYETLWSLMDTQARAVPWPALPIAQTFWLALRPAASCVMGLLRWSEASGHTTWASDAVDALLDDWQHSALGKAENQRAALEFYMATQTLRFLAGCKSPVFREGRGLILAATLAERVLRYTYVGASAVQGTALRCALTGEPIQPGTAYHAWDVQWRPLLSEACGPVLTVVVAAECSAWPLNEAMTETAAAPEQPAKNKSDLSAQQQTKRKTKKKEVAEPAAEEEEEVERRPKKRKRDTKAAADAGGPAKKAKSTSIAPLDPWPDVPVFHGQHPDLALEGLVLRGGRDVDAWVRAKACYAQHAATLKPELLGLMRDAAACGTRDQLDAWSKTSVSLKMSSVAFKVVSLLAMALWVPVPADEEEKEEDIMALFDDDRLAPMTAVELDPVARLCCHSLAHIVTEKLGTTLTLDLCMERHPEMVAAAWLALAPHTRDRDV